MRYLPSRGTEISDSSPPIASTGHGWPPLCTLADLARILTMIHGHQAPTESSLKKWSAGGEFSRCAAAPIPDEPGQAPSSSFTREALLRRQRGGRPGLRLDTRLAINRVYELWPHLTDTSSHAVLDLAVARAADSLESRLHHLVSHALPAPSPAPASTAVDPVAPPPNELVQELLRQITSMREEMTEVRREVAQFSAMRNNLITKLDDAVARAQEAIASGGARSGGGTDPLVEARRDRDMGVVKSMLTEILESVNRK